MKKQYKIVICLSILFNIILLITGFTEKNIINSRGEIFLDNKLVNCNHEVYNINGVTYASVRDLYESMGYTVSYDENNGNVMVLSNNNIEKVLYVSDDTEGVLYNGRKYKYISQGNIPTILENNYYGKIPQIKGYIQSPELAAILGQIYLGIYNNSTDKITMVVRFNYDEQYWYVSAISDVPIAHGFNAVIIDAISGGLKATYRSY